MILDSQTIRAKVKNTPIRSSDDLCYELDDFKKYKPIQFKGIENDI